MRTVDGRVTSHQVVGGVGMKLQEVAKDIMTTDGTEQTLLENPGLSNLSGFIDLSALASGDTIIIRQYLHLNGSYRLYAEETYSGPQARPALYCSSRGSISKMKMTLQQTAGPYRGFAYEFIKEV